MSREFEYDWHSHAKAVPNVAKASADTTNVDLFFMATLH